QEPRHHRVGDRNLVNVATLQLGEEVVDLHCCVFGATTFCTRASKRGSPCSGSSIGSTLIGPTFDPSWSAKLCSSQRSASSLLFRLKWRRAREWAATSRGGLISSRSVRVCRA